MQGHRKSCQVKKQFVIFGAKEFMIVANTWKLLIHNYFGKIQDYFWMNLQKSTLAMNSHC